MLQAVYRIKREGTLDSPVRVRSAGHYTVNRNWRDTPLTKNFLELFWCVSGTAHFSHPTGDWLLSANEICLLLPGDRHEISAETPLEYYWMTLDGPQLDLILAWFGSRRLPRRAGHCPEELFLRLFRELADLGMQAEISAGALGYEILARALQLNPEEPNSLVERFQAEVRHHFADAELSVAKLAGKLAVHRSTLARQVAAHCGLPPQEYLNSVRLQHAVTLLRTSGLTVKEIAEASGFSDQNYFSKAFLRNLGMTPSQMRARSADSPHP